MLVTCAVGPPSASFVVRTYVQVDEAKEMIKHRVIEKVEAKQIPHQVLACLQ